MRQTPQAMTLSSTCPGWGWGFATSSIDSQLPAACEPEWKTAAFIVRSSDYKRTLAKVTDKDEG